MAACYPCIQIEEQTLKEPEMMRRNMLLILSAAALTFALPAAAQQGKYQAEYRLSTVVGTAFPWGKGGEIWANLVRERTRLAQISPPLPQGKAVPTTVDRRYSGWYLPCL